jgi:lysozyme
MKLSPNGEAFIKRWEGLRLTPYMDQAGHWTVGWGHKMDAHDPKHGTITLDRAKDLFRIDSVRCQDAILQEVHRDLTQQQLDSLVALEFNIGYLAFHQSTLLRFLNLGYGDDRLEEWWKAWNKITIAGKKDVDNGLVNRRAAEWAVWKWAHYGD